MEPHFALIQNLGPWEIGAIVLIVLLLFGGKKLPELARGAGKALKEFRSATAEAEKTFKNALDESDEQDKSTRPKVGREPESQPDTSGSTKSVSGKGSQ